LPGTYEPYVAVPADILKVGHHGQADSTGSITVSEHFPAPERSLMTAARRGFSSVFKNCIGFFPHFKSISAFIVTAAENKVN